MQKSAGSRQAHALPIYRCSLPVCGDTTMNMPWPSCMILSSVEPFASAASLLKSATVFLGCMVTSSPTVASVQCIALAASEFQPGEFHPGAVGL